MQARYAEHMLVSWPYSIASDINCTIHKALIKSVITYTCPDLGLAHTKQGYLQYWRHSKTMCMWH